jgi:hypothetical protein
MDERETAQPRSTMDRAREYPRSRSLEASGRHLTPYLSTAKKEGNNGDLSDVRIKKQREIFEWSGSTDGN